MNLINSFITAFLLVSYILFQSYQILVAWQHDILHLSDFHCHYKLLQDSISTNHNILGLFGPLNFSLDNPVILSSQLCPWWIIHSVCYFVYFQWNKMDVKDIPFFLTLLVIWRMLFGTNFLIVLLVSISLWSKDNLLFGIP